MMVNDMKLINTNQYTTVREICELTGIEKKTVVNTIHRLFPNKMQHGKTTYLTELEFVQIKNELFRPKNLNCESAFTVTTKLERSAIIHRAMLILQEDIEDLQKQNASLKHENTVLQPKAEFADNVRFSKNGILVREFVKVLRPETGEKRFYQWLREQKIIMPNSTEPYQAFIDKGYFKRKEYTYQDGSGKSYTDFTTLVTGKGQVWLEKKWRNGQLFLL